MNEMELLEATTVSGLPKDGFDEITITNVRTH
jgi:hypothetical protein